MQAYQVLLIKNKNNIKLIEKYHIVMSNKHWNKSQSDHVNHFFQLKDVKILQTKTNWQKRLFAEMVLN